MSSQVDNVYGKTPEDIEIPEGHIWVGFRNPELEELFITEQGLVARLTGFGTEFTLSKKDKNRVIVEYENSY